jgi:2-polyprenyl-6-hydroxyphenyl methylase/3-demethylubiquinone-9 3-methyltransferase
MKNYYSNKLSAEKLELCYQLAPERVKQYLRAEIEFVNDKIKPNDKLLELGCGYGRVLENLSSGLECITGIDTSLNSLLLAKKRLTIHKNIFLFQMNAGTLGFRDNHFDAVICIQNGISVFNNDKLELLREAVRVTKNGGTVLFSSYAEEFWEDRLNWFQIQADHNLVGEIDYNLTGKGVITCYDGFKATTTMENEFIKLCAQLEYFPEIVTVDNSSVFCIIKK